MAIVVAPERTLKIWHTESFVLHYILSLPFVGFLFTIRIEYRQRTMIARSLRMHNSAISKRTISLQCTKHTQTIDRVWICMQAKRQAMCGSLFMHNKIWMCSHTPNNYVFMLINFFRFFICDRNFAVRQMVVLIPLDAPLNGRPIGQCRIV